MNTVSGSSAGMNTVGPDQVSLVTSFDLPTIPSPTTVLPFPEHRLITSFSVLGSRVYPAGRPFGRRNAVARFGVRHYLAGSPEAWPKRVHLITDWSFTSCCSPPDVAVEQLRLVTGS